ncbi:uncharacterized protein LOC135842432 [Planococcus citri]|uniref:uncharacterized protein LOC135842432 n=1 Tax=Planococcus citri TaxID=170843 RepID=UPI0031FA1F80
MVKMNSVLVRLLLSACLVITISIILVEGKNVGKMWDLRYIKECKEELNLTNYHFTVTDLKTIGIPTTLEQGCILDCYYFKMGKIKKKNQTSFIEHKFIGLPPKAGSVENDSEWKSGSFLKREAEAAAKCADYLTGHHIEECNLIYQHRYCVSKVMNGTQIPPKLIED